METDDPNIRQFGLISAVLLPLIAWLWGGTTPVVLMAAGVGLVLAVLSWLAPLAVRPVYVGLTIVTYPIGVVVSELILWTVFAAVMCPIGLVFRILGRDALNRIFDASAATYWSERSSTKPARSYFRQW